MKRSGFYGIRVTGLLGPESYYSTSKYYKAQVFINVLNAKILKNRRCNNEY